MENFSNINLFRYTDDKGQSDFVFSICTDDKPPVYRYFTFQKENDETQLIRISNIMDFISEGKQISEPIPTTSPEYTIFINKISEINKKLLKTNNSVKLSDILLSTELLKQEQQNSMSKNKK